MLTGGVADPADTDGHPELDGRSGRDGHSGFDGAAYQATFDRLAGEGVDVHGEATLVRSLAPLRVLDAGCGTGRVAIELDRHGIEVTGVDIDASMLSEARLRAPGITWHLADLSRLALGQHFDVVVMAGNVPLFCPPDDRPALIAACGRHVAAGGWLLAAFRLDGDVTTAYYDRHCAAAGLELAERWATWDRQPFDGGDYAVSLHRRPPAGGARMAD